MNYCYLPLSKSIAVFSVCDGTSQPLYFMRCNSRISVVSLIEFVYLIAYQMFCGPVVWYNRWLGGTAASTTSPTTI